MVVMPVVASTLRTMVESHGSSGSVVIKVGMLGDSQIGKTSLMVKYVEGHFDEDYIQTLGASSWSPLARPRSLTGGAMTCVRC